MQSAVSGFRLQVPSLDTHPFSPGTTVLLKGRPGVGKSFFSEQFLMEGLQAGQHAIYVVTDSSADSLRKKAATSKTDAQLHVVDLFLEKPRMINDVSITVHQTITKYSGAPVRVAFDSLSTLGMVLTPAVIPPWLLDQRARFMKSNANVLALFVYDTGIHPPAISRSLQVLTDVVLDMKLEDLVGEPKRFFRVFSARGIAQTPKWFEFKISDAGILFTDQ